MSGALIAGADIVARVGQIVGARLAMGLFQTRILDMADVEARSRADGAPFRRWINGQEGADAQALTDLDGATITYGFIRVGPAVALALRACQERSPDPGGAYSRSWFVLVNGAPWTQALDLLPVDTTVYVVNFVPYARRLEQGWHRARSQRHRPGLFITEGVRQLVQSAFPDIAVNREFVSLTSAPPGSTNWPVPYVRRRGESRGEPILYPAVSLIARG